MKQSFSTTVTFAFLAITLSLPTGCTGLPGKGSLSKKMPWSKKEEPPKPYPNPVKMAATWTPDTLVQTGRTPTRGFGGRMFFYDEKTKAVPVDGELTVHAFAEGADGEQTEVKRYHFTAEQFTKHFSQSDLGASYSVWIPWDAVGGDQTRVTLVPSFRAASGKFVQGDQALVGLPGKRHIEESMAAAPNAASLLEATRDSGKSGLVTTTIPVHSALNRTESRSLTPIAQPQSSSFAVNTKLAPKTSAVATSIVPASAISAAPNASLQPQQSEPSPTKPLRLGQSKATNQAVIHASATLPLE